MSGIAIGNNVVNGGDVPKLSSGDGSPSYTGTGNEMYYDYTDQQLYGWNGSSWDLLSGGGAIPNLQQVTDAGNVTTNAVKVIGVTGRASMNSDGTVQASSGNGVAQLMGNNLLLQGGYLSLTNNSNFSALLFADLLTSPQLFRFPNSSGKLIAGDSGVINLVSGVATITSPYATANSTAQITCKAASGTTIGAVYSAVCFSGTISVRSLQITGAIQTLDNSTVQWLLIA